jgi:hypothetical protein
MEKTNGYKKREQWFLDRVGKVVFRGPVTCTCQSCIDGHVKGVLIADRDHALYLHDIENELRIRYMDNKLPS